MCESKGPRESVRGRKGLLKFFVAKCIIAFILTYCYGGVKA
jgi:hypothetical protein